MWNSNFAQELGLRSGTENVAMCSGLGAAAAEAAGEGEGEAREKAERQRKMRDRY